MTMMWLAALAAASALSDGGAAVPKAVVSRDGTRWTIDYTLPGAAAAWVFPVSAPTMGTQRPWRDGDWRVVTPGVRIERRGAYDMLVPTHGRYVPRQVRLSFIPSAVTLEREYDPAVSFGNGSMALYSDQFDLVPASDLAAIATREAGLSARDLGGDHAAVRFHDAAGPVFVGGKRIADPILRGAATYVVFGAAAIEDVGGIAMLADPALPLWLKTDLAGFVPRVAATYAARLGPRDDPRLPLLLIGWRGATPGKVINDGGVRPGEILLNFEGEGLVDRNDKAARRTRWFLAHELSHFWLGSEGVAYRAPADAWITEGGAEMMAFTLLAASDHAYALAELQRAVDDCVRAASKPVATAGERHDGRTFYACGTVFALAATGVVRQHGGKDVFDFLRPLLTTHRSDRLIGREEWLSDLAGLEGGEAAATAIRVMIERGSDDPAADVSALLRSTGVSLTRTGDTLILASDAI